MDLTSTIGAIVAIVTAILALGINLHVLHEHRRKKFKAELENYEEYFHKYYLPETCKNINLLIKDKAAQNLTRLKFIDHSLLTYFINLHEKRLLVLDQILDLLFFSHSLINISVIEEKYEFKSKLLFPKVSMALNYFGYVFFLLYAIYLYMPFSSEIFEGWIKIFVTIGAIFAGFISLNRAVILAKIMDM
ncbi:hypothetical protein B9T26_14360 [Acinetobacter sp. ANC 4169]|uniref:hypothetical protein n=1 Tax=Acinetobacter sp. ANC 4169 TaxID=1977879 RepID=UPI000A346F43|nr:hypothetical protein [Acinetobacter sp. ANC 4169]OTG69955.1 hypothetical protein B9T26_14360 [Acinetobacter sp. ANC 4169]